MILQKLTEKEFAQMAKLVYDRTGIYLPESKLALLSNRLRKRMRALKLNGFSDYYDLLQDPKRCDEELPNFLSAITTNETYFFRNENLWAFFRNEWIPELVERKAKSLQKTVRVWSAASSSGEEAYTAAICLRECLPKFESWQVVIVGSDISERVLDRARAGIYNAYAVSKVSAETLRRWFEGGGEENKLKPAIKDLVRFQNHNLRDPFPNANFDFVFLRNVLMYFDQAMKVRVLENIVSALRPAAQVFIGDVDPVRSVPALGAATSLEYCGPNLYRKPLGAPKAALAASGK